jgi:hypothetical protein
MTTAAFVDFDVNLAGMDDVGPSNWGDQRPVPGVFHYRGVATSDQSIGTNAHGHTGRTANSGAYGLQGSAISGATRTTYVTNKGVQMAIRRSVYSIGSEVWLTMDMKGLANIGATSLSSAYEPTADWAQMFRWGDVSIRCKSATYEPPSSPAQYTMLFSIRNNGTEVATLSVPNVLPTDWMFLTVYVKLDATTGAITCTIDGVAQSVAYTGQNTVAVIALASATEVYFSPWTLDNLSTLYSGSMDNVWIGTVGFPAGRPRGERWRVLSDNTLVNWEAEGTAPTTVTVALFDAADAKAARGHSGGGSALLNMQSYVTTGLETDLVGFNLYCKKPSNRDANADRRLSVGMSLSGVHSMGTVVAGTVLSVDSVGTPPAVAFVHLTDYVYQKSGGGSFTITDLSTILARLLTV